MNNAMDTKIDVDQESNKAATTGLVDMRTGFRFLSGEDRKQFAKQIVEQCLQRKRQEIEGKEISLNQAQALRSRHKLFQVDDRIRL